MAQRDEVLQQLAAHRSELERFEVRRLAVFGSISRNEARPESDVDLIVEFHGAATFDRFVALSFYLEDLLGRKVDLLTERSLPAALRSAVL